MIKNRRVAVTGMGMVTPLGFDERTLWQNLLAGQTGIARLTAFDLAPYKVKTGAEVDTQILEQALEALGLRHMDRAIDMALVASAYALQDAGILTGGETEEPLAAGAVFGTGLGCSHSTWDAYSSFAEKGFRGLRPTTVPRCMANAISAQVSLRYKLTGPNYVINCACSSSSTAIGAGFRMIRDGYADAVLCGGTDAVFDPGMFGCWDKLGVLSRIEDPRAASRPYAEDRQGTVLGEGAACLLLESLEGAEKRGARVWSEILGYGESSDAVHITCPNSEGQARAIRDAMTCGGVSPADIAYINGHGTATRANDTCECVSIRLALGEDADRVPVGSTKSFTGHALGASGAIETVATILALKHGVAPRNLNLDHPDPACDVRLIGKTPEKLDGNVAINSSFGFGGHNAVLVLRSEKD